MANVPTYAQVGIGAAWIVTICRVLQGLSTMGEVIGANIYVTEITKPPLQYPAVALMAISGVLGGVFALGLATYVTTYAINWRWAFWIGAVIAIIGTVARTKLRETKEFSDAKYRIEKTVKSKANIEILEKSKIWTEKLSKKTALSLFFIECSWPVCFYIAFIYCGDILKMRLGLSPEEVISQNFIVSLVQFMSWIILAILSYKIYPISILKFKLVIFGVFISLLPFLLEIINSQFQIFLIQSFVVVFGFMGTPAVPIFYKHLPVFKRFTYAAFMYALSRAIMYIVTSFGMVYFTNILGNAGLMVILIPTLLIYTYAVYYFGAIDKKIE
jgi:MFS family permease